MLPLGRVDIISLFTLLSCKIVDTLIWGTAKFGEDRNSAPRYYSIH